MLVMSRKVGDALVINHDIEVVVVEIRADKVRLGVTLPKDIPLHRKEVYDAIHGHKPPPAPPPVAAPRPPVVTPAPQTVASAEVVARHLDAIRAALLAAAADGVRVTITAG